MCVHFQNNYVFLFIKIVSCIVIKYVKLPADSFYVMQKTAILYNLYD